jgi:hypothetical protein
MRKKGEGVEFLGNFGRHPNKQHKHCRGRRFMVRNAREPAANDEVQCETCGKLNLADEYWLVRNRPKCPHCGVINLSPIFPKPTVYFCEQCEKSVSV